MKTYLLPRVRFSHAAVVMGLGVMVGLPANASLTYTITYTAAVQANSNFASIQNAVLFVENEFSALYSDNVNLNFTIDQNTSGLGSSLFSNAYFRGDYASIQNALTGDAKTTDDGTFNTALPGADPNVIVSGGVNATNDWVATSANAKALGLIAGNNAASDGTYTFNASQIYTYDPLNRSVAGAFDFIGVTEHEFSELMGRTTQIGNTGFGNLVFDLGRFTAPAIRSFANTGAGVYFSVNNGVTNLKNYNPGGGDVQDWDGSVLTDPFNASTGPGQGHVISGVDMRVLDVIGWDLQATPEPSLFIPVAGALGIMLLRRKRV